MNKPRRSALYVPADNPRALQKARGLQADLIILDLEDAVAPAAKADARAAACAAIAAFAPRPVLLRINALTGPWGQDDLAAAKAARPDGVLLPKVSGADDILAAQSEGLALWAMIETPRAVLNLAAIAASGVAGLVLGSNDLLKDMEARPMPDAANLHAAMSLCVMAARAHGIAVLDGVYNDIADAEGFAAAARRARDFGFDGKTVIHPAQIAPCNAAFTPGDDEIAAARAIVDAFAAQPEAGVIALDGRMVERLHAESAARLLARIHPKPEGAGR
ncbi:MAG TPA: CoA ester lyase [Rhizomicrobium sp.]|nr:CoA ester lyase [Rhizomicrobium sp.]